MKQQSVNSLVLLRLALGFVFLWTFLDKTFGLGFSTSPERSWAAGVSPTTGFLNNAPKGPFAQTFTAMSGSVVVDLLFMLGMLGVGMALVLGIGMLIATISGSLLMLLIYLSMFPPSNNPLVDQHIVYIFALWVLYCHKAGQVYGLGKWWSKTPLVKQLPWLK